MANPKLVVEIIANTQALLKNLEAGRGAIESYGPTIAKMQDTWKRNSAQVVEKAAVVTAAMKGIAVGTLSASDAAKNLRTLDTAMAQMRRTGQPIPAEMIRTADSLRQVGTSAKASTGLFSSLRGEVGRMALGFVSAQAIIGGVRMAWRGLTSFMSGSLDAWKSQESATKTLTVAMQAQGRYTPHLLKQYQDLASQFQKTTIYGDELVEEMIALLIQLGNVAPSQMKKALEASLNLASGLGVDLKAATLLVGKAFAGETSSLSRYGIIISETEKKTKGAALATVDAINVAFGGQAQAQIQTTSGRLIQLTNAWGDFQEEVGSALSDVLLPILPALGQVVTWLSHMLAAVISTGQAVQKWFVATLISANTAVLGFALTLAEASQKVPVLGKHFGASADAVQSLREQVQSGRDKLQAFLTTTDKTTSSVSALSTQQVRAVAITKEETAEMKKAAAEAQKAAEEIRKKAEAEAKAVRVTIQTIEGTKAATLATGDFGRDIERVGTRLKVETSPVLLRTTQDLDMLGRTLRTHVAPALDETGQSIKTGLIDTLGALPDLLAQAFTGGGGLVGAFKALGVKAGTVIGEGLGNTFSALGSVAGPLGAVFGSVFGNVVDWFRNFGGPSQAELVGRELVASFEAGFGGGAEMIAAVQEAYTAMGRSGAEANAAITAMWDAERGGAEVTQAAIDEINAVLEAHQDWLTQIGAAFETMQSAANAAYGVITPAIRDAIEQTRELTGLTDDQKAALDNLLSTGPDYAALTKMAEGYGISLAQLGPKFQQADLSKTALQYASDMEVLIAAGADVNGVLIGMQDEVQGALDQAWKFGGEIPAALRPFIEQMVASGLLTDEFGKKLTDTAGISFADTDPLPTALKNLDQTIRDLIDTIREVPSAINDINRTRLDTKHVQVVYDDPGYIGSIVNRMVAGAAQGGVVYAAAGRVLPFAPRGTDTVPAMLTPGEGVLSVRDMQALGGPTGFAALRQDLRSGGRGQVYDFSAMKAEIVALRRDVARQARETPTQTATAIRDALLQAGFRR